MGELLLAAYQEYSAGAPPELWAPYAQDIANVAGRAGDAQAIVAEDAGVLLGSITLYLDGAAGQAWPAGWAGIRLLGVAPAARGQGIGRRLTEECILRARAAGRSHLGLHTTEMMAAARALYERMGFTRLPDFDHHYGPIHLLAYGLVL